MNSMLKILLVATAIVSFSVVARLSVAEGSGQTGDRRVVSGRVVSSCQS